MSTDAAVDLGALFEGASGSVVRIEARERYSIGGEDQSLRAFLEGRPRPERSVRTDPYLRRLARLTDRGVTWERLRVIDTPPTPYQRWELLAYVENAAAGEQITLAPRDVVPLVGDDVWIIDNTTVIELRYDENDAFIGLRDVSARDGRATVWGRFAELVRANGIPLNEYLAGDAGARRAS